MIYLFTYLTRSNEQMHVVLFGDTIYGYNNHKRIHVSKYSYCVEFYNYVKTKNEIVLENSNDDESKYIPFTIQECDVYMIKIEKSHTELKQLILNRIFELSLNKIII